MRRERRRDGCTESRATIRVLSIFGTRPEAIKMSAVLRRLAAEPDRFDSRICVTAQHRQMLDQVLDLFAIRPDYDLDIMRPGQPLSLIVAAIAERLDPIVELERPDWVLVQGDTTTTMAAALVAFHRHVRVGHIEAGLRTYDRTQPFPEEINRRLTTVLADLHFAPTAWAAGNLRREGVPEEQILVTGNTVIDALQQVAAMPFDPAGTPLARLPLGRGRIVLVTAHRRENLGERLEQICTALRAVARRYADVQLVFPVHLNPSVQEPVYRILGELPNVFLLPPLDYQPLVWLLTQCAFVITDSGGLQEKAPGLGKPVLVLRETTERPEAVAAGTVRLIGPAPEQVIAWAGRLLDDAETYSSMARAVNPYGDGRAALRIVRALRDGDGVQPQSRSAGERVRELATLPG